MVTRNNRGHEKVTGLRITPYYVSKFAAGFERSG